LPASRADRDDVSFYFRVAVDRSLTDPAKNRGVPPRSEFRSSGIQELGVVLSEFRFFGTAPIVAKRISSRIRGPEQEPIETRFLCRCAKAINAGKRPSHQWKMVENFSIMAPRAKLRSGPLH
jgi:hypothetical protein